MSSKNSKTQAEKAANSAQKKRITNRSKTSKTPVNKTIQKTKQEHTIPVRFITSTLFLGLFIVFLVIFFLPEGAIIKLFNDLVHGLIGRAGFVVSIPVSLFLFFIHAFSGKRPVKMRTICAVGFMLMCGCITHLILDPQNLPDGIKIVPELYLGGIDCTTGGLVCGGLALIVKWLCGPVISYIVFIILALVLLLASMQITIPSIVRAIQNRPRANWENDKEDTRQEPAALVVNHLANKRIEYIEKHKNVKSEHQLTERSEVEPKPQEIFDVNKDTKRSDEIFRQIDGDVHDPVAAAAHKVADDDQGEIISIFTEKSKSTSNKMPPLELDDIAQEEPVAEPVIVPEVSTKKQKVTSSDAEKAAADVAVEIAKSEAENKQVYRFPPIDLLKSSYGNAADGTMEMRENKYRLDETLASFKIEAHIINVTRGPSVTRYEVELEKGVRLSKLTTAADDIALSLGATGVRIAAVPGKSSVVGIEVPNKTVTTVSLRDVIDSKDFVNAKSTSSFAVGKDISGNNIIGNISRLPHMLIAGTTGSGKSVCMNSIIISLLYKASPDDVKLIMVDPKMVELGIYNGMPHLLIPVVTDPKKAAGSLQWAVTEMLRRYSIMRDVGVRDLESYNSVIETEEEPGTKLPRIVVIIDELADLMLVAAKEVEESICRIAQMGRAAGVHLIIATQRPSADVITGLMKANIPSRIAFAVASAMESRIILDTQGAEKLVGKGDMLYAPIGSGKPQRVQGCFVSDPEVEAVANYIKTNCVTDYDEQVLQEIELKAAQTGSNKSAPEPEANADELGGDEMLPAAVDVILETGQASVSMLQRRLKLGYARAARIVDEMEERGIVGPFVGSKPRSILITKEQWESMKNGQTEQLEFSDMEEAEDVDSSNEVFE